MTSIEYTWLMENGEATVTADAAQAVEAFVAKWRGVTASELSTAQTFAIDLCHLLDVAPPHADAEQQYMFERPVTFTHGDGSTSAGRIDLYKRGCFVLEAKKLKAPTSSKGFDGAMLRAHSQAQRYARALPAVEGRPPFLMVVDVGNRIELFSEFSRSGATYTPFPDPRSYRITLDDLRKPAIRERLRKVWSDPLALDPSRESARVTREIAARLAELAKSLEQAGHAPEAVAQFLMRCLFTMFAEDVALLPPESFRTLLMTYAKQPDTAMRMLGQLWHDMDGGGFSAAIASDVLRFNGKLFKTPDVLPLTQPQVALLIEAARAKWEHVEPAIFGTLLERALAPDERHKLGAHYTPRAYVERLVLPTIIEPLRHEWSDAQAAALTLAADGKHDKDAVDVLRAFHHRLCTVRVLDPACGSGNFLYVTLEHLKRLEGEVLNALDELGYRQTGLAIDGERADAMAGETVDPHQLLGIELNPRAAAIAEVVLWIGYLQWHFRTHGDVKPPEPVVRDFRNIENRDAVLAYDRMEYVTDERGVPVSRWDGETMKPSPVTGEPIPDETARVPLERYVNPRKATWPEADFVVGNPPFIGASNIRRALGDGYTEALRKAWPKVPESADYVMYWWHHAATLAQDGVLQRFGFITTNSISQTFNRRVIETAMSAKKDALCLAFAIPDHPWVDAADGAAVRIAMTVGSMNVDVGQLQFVEGEARSNKDAVAVTLRDTRGVIHADLRAGADVAAAQALRANEGLSCPGLKLHGAGFIVTHAEAKTLGLGETAGSEQYIRPYRNGRDLTGTSRDAWVIDLFGLEAAQVRERFPALYQHVLNYVKPERDAKSRTKDGAGYARLWWLHGKPRQALRQSLAGLQRYIVTVETSKHRMFQFLDIEVAPDNRLVCIALSDAWALGVLSSMIHITWAMRAGGTLEDRPVYNKTRCFEPFPFPAAASSSLLPSGEDARRADEGACRARHTDTPSSGAARHLPPAGEGTAERIRELGEQLDAHRKRQQAAYPDLTLTGMYNVLDKLRSGEALIAKERVIHEHGLVSVLRQLHDDLDAAVLDAYGWSDLLPTLRIAHGNEAAGGPSSGAARHLLPDGEGKAEAKRAFDEAILERLVALNAERAAEEARGQIRWLRPAFQHPDAVATPQQADLDASSDADTSAPLVAKKRPWPKDAIEQVRAVAEVITASAVPLSLAEIAAHFSARGTWKKRLPPLLDILVTLGRVTTRNDHYTSA